MLLGKKTDDGVVLREEDGAVAKALMSTGYLLVETVGEMPSADYFETNYDVSEDGTRLLQSFFVPPRAPRTFSKLRLKSAIATAGLLPAFKELLAGMEVAPGYSAQEAFDDAVNLSEAHPRFVEAVDIAKQVLAVSDEQVESILAASVAEGSA